LQEQLIHQHQIILDKQAEFHKQRYKKRWVTEGDRNIQFLQQAILKRVKKNGIIYLSDENGRPLTTQHQIADCFNNYLKNLFLSSSLQSEWLVTDHDQHAHLQDSDFTNSIPDKIELWSILKNMKKDAAPGPDGLNVAFYRATWDWISDDVVSLVQNFYQTGMLPSKLKKMFIVLIPKKPTRF
jgi:hypothetical protein